jgi:DNA-directed RNA polymerase subunit omega
MNSELVKKALEKVTNPHVLVNLLSRRVRQLNVGNGSSGRPMVANTENLGVADIALREIIEEKMGFDLPEILELTRPTGRGRRRPQNWGREQQHPPINGRS